MREQPVGCVHQSFAEFQAGVHTTFNDDRLCDRCRTRLDLARRSPAACSETRESARPDSRTLVGGGSFGMGDPPPAPSPAASSDALQVRSGSTFSVGACGSSRASLSGTRRPVPAAGESA